MKVICSKFHLDEKLGAGTYGEVYKGENVYTHEKVAVKIELRETKSDQLHNEYQVYRLLAGSEGIPYIRYFGREEGHNTMVMELLGKSLDELFIQCNRKFSLKTVLMIADQLITRLEYLHTKNLIHRDIKPKNFAIGRGTNENQIYIIDMGLAKRYCDPITHKHICNEEGKSLVGTARYTSVFTHLGYEQSRRDDLEGVAYTLIHFLKGTLPWTTLQNKTKKEKIKEIGQLKSETPINEVCADIPEEFAIFLEKTRQLGFDEKPDYAGYRALFRDLFIREGYVYDYDYDWTETKPIMQKETKIKRHQATKENITIVSGLGSNPLFVNKKPASANARFGSLHSGLSRPKSVAQFSRGVPKLLYKGGTKHAAGTLK